MLGRSDIKKKEKGRISSIRLNPIIKKKTLVIWKMKNECENRKNE